MAARIQDTLRPVTDRIGSFSNDHPGISSFVSRVSGLAATQFLFTLAMGLYFGPSVGLSRHIYAASLASDITVLNTTALLAGKSLSSFGILFLRLFPRLIRQGIKPFDCIKFIAKQSNVNKFDEKFIYNHDNDHIEERKSSPLKTITQIEVIWLLFSINITTYGFFKFGLVTGALYGLKKGSSLIWSQIQMINNPAPDAPQAHVHNDDAATAALVAHVAAATKEEDQKKEDMAQKKRNISSVAFIENALTTLPNAKAELQKLEKTDNIEQHAKTCTLFARLGIKHFLTTKPKDKPNELPYYLIKHKKALQDFQTRFDEIPEERRRNFLNSFMEDKAIANNQELNQLRIDLSYFSGYKIGSDSDFQTTLSLLVEKSAAKQTRTPFCTLF